MQHINEEVTELSLKIIQSYLIVRSVEFIFN